MLCLQLLSELHTAAVADPETPLVHDWWHQCPYRTGLVDAANSAVNDEVAPSPSKTAGVAGAIGQNFAKAASPGALLREPNGTQQNPNQMGPRSPGRPTAHVGDEAEREEPLMTSTMARKCATTAAAAFHVELFKCALLRTAAEVAHKRKARIETTIAEATEEAGDAATDGNLDNDVPKRRGRQPKKTKGRPKQGLLLPPVPRKAIKSAGRQDFGANLFFAIPDVHTR